MRRVASLRAFRVLSLLVLLGGAACAGAARADAPAPWAAEGLRLGLRYTGEVVGDVSGGMRRGAAYEGRAELDVDADLDKLAGWHGARLHASVYQIGGYGPSANYVGNLMDVSNIEAAPTVRLYALWVEKEFLGRRASLRAGQLGADEDFLISDTASPLMNGTFGWAALAANDQTAGGSAYPLATPGLRLRYVPARHVAFLLGAYAGNPAGSRCQASPQRCDRYGTTFSTSGGTLWMGELQRSLKLGNGRLPGRYKLGGWYETGSRPDEGYGELPSGAIVSLAAGLPTSPLEHHDDWGIYAIADQTLWRAAGESVDGFLRVGGAPADRDLISFYVDAGLSWTGLIARRPNDALTLGVAYARISPDAAALDRARRALVDPGYPVRDFESVLELTYVARLTRQVSLQPDLQFVVHPGGYVPNPDDPSRVIANAVVVALRASLRF